MRGKNDRRGGNSEGLESGGLLVVFACLQRRQKDGDVR